MISKNKFFIKNIKDVIVFGQHENLKDLIEINKSLKIKTTIITTTDQRKRLIKKLILKFLIKLMENLKNL